MDRIEKLIVLFQLMSKKFSTSFQVHFMWNSPQCYSMQFWQLTCDKYVYSCIPVPNSMMIKPYSGCILAIMQNLPTPYLRFWKKKKTAVFRWYFGWMIWTCSTQYVIQYVSGFQMHLIAFLLQFVLGPFTCWLDYKLRHQLYIRNICIAVLTKFPCWSLWNPILTTTPCWTRGPAPCILKRPSGTQWSGWTHVSCAISCWTLWPPCT